MRCGLLVMSGLLAAVLGSSLAARAVALPPGVTSDFQPDPASVTRYGPAYKYPQAGWWVLHIEGKPYERGYQHGRLMAREIQALVHTLATAHSPKSPEDAWKLNRKFVDALLLRRYASEYLEEMKGIADGASMAGARFDERPLDLVDIVCINSDFETDFLGEAMKATANGLEGQKFKEPPLGQPIERGPDRCSAFAATGPATADGQIVFGHVTMFQLHYVQHYNVWLDVQPAAGHRVVMQSYPGGIMSGLDYYLCSSGILISETTIDQTAFDVRGMALFSRIRQAAQYADSIDKVTEILKTDNNGLYSNEWLIADTKTGEIAMFELGTHRTRLWRSSRGEWFGGTEGFYWGCNQPKDTAVFSETLPSLRGKPGNLVVAPGERDVTWLRMFDKHRGRIGLDFGFEVFTTNPLISHFSCDAKFTTTALAKDLKSWSIFGPPGGLAWEASPEERKRYPEMLPLVSNDWTLLGVTAPPLSTEAKDIKGTSTLAFDLKSFPKADEHESKHATALAYPAAWHGTVLPAEDSDVWLATGFAEHERVVAIEQAHRAHAAGKALDEGARDAIELARFQPWSHWLAGEARHGSELPLAQLKRTWRDTTWMEIAAGKGAMLLAALSQEMGTEKFVAAMDSFGLANAGKKVSSAKFFEHLEQAHQQPLATVARPWLESTPPAAARAGNFFSIYSFSAERAKTLIVYGTLADSAAQREAALRLQRTVARCCGGSMPELRTDQEVSEAELKSRHLLLVGRPATNRITARCAESLPIKFGSSSFVCRDTTYAHPATAVIAAGINPWEPRYSVVVFAGLSADATWHLVDHLPKRDEPAPQILLRPAGGTERRLGTERFRP